MTRALVPCLLLAFFGAPCSECAAQPARTARPARPSAKERKTVTPADQGIRMTRDFGLLESGAEVEEVFELRNDSADPLRFVDSRASCGCVSIVDHPRSIDAGESVSIALRLDTSGLRGAVKHSVTFKVDHPKQRYVQLVLGGTVRGVWTEPETVDLGSITSQRLARRRFLVFAAGMPDLKILSVRASDASLQVSDEPAHADDAATRKDIRAVRSVVVDWGDAMGPPGMYSSEVVVDTSEQGRPTVKVSVTAHITGAVDVKPPLLMFGTVVHDQSVERSCRVKLGDDDAPQRLDRLVFEADNEQVVCRLAKQDEGDAAVGTLRIVLTGASGTGELMKGAVRGKRDAKVVVSIPYVAYLAPE